MDGNYFDKAFESKNLGRIDSSNAWLKVDRALRLALQNCKPTTKKSKGIPPNSRHLAEVLIWEAFDFQSCSIEFRSKEEIANRAGLWVNEVREALEDLRENGVITYEDTGKHKVSILIQRATEFWKYPQRVDLKTLAVIRAGFRFDSDPYQPAIEYQGVVLQGFEPSLRETQYRNAMDMAQQQIESETQEAPSVSTPDFAALRRAADGKDSVAGSKPKEFPSVSAKAEGTPSISSSPLSFKRSPTTSALSLENLKVQLASSEEREAMEACAQILGDEVWEGTGPSGDRPIGDGGKWRLRWRGQRSKVLRVFRTILEDTVAGKRYDKIGGHAEWLWKGFS